MAAGNFRFLALLRSKLLRNEDDWMNTKENLEHALTNLWAGELAAVVVFWFDFFLLKNRISGTSSLVSIAFSLFVLSFILLQGSVFWWILLKRLSKPTFGVKYTGKVYWVLKGIDVMLLCLAVFPIVQCSMDLKRMLISCAIWLFALVEWVNYFIVRLSYSLNPGVLLEIIKSGKLKKSRIAREIEKGRKG